MKATRTNLAKAVVRFAELGGMPGSYWKTDRRVAMAREVLGAAGVRQERKSAAKMKARRQARNPERFAGR